MIPEVAVNVSGLDLTEIMVRVDTLARQVRELLERNAVPTLSPEQMAMSLLRAQAAGVAEDAAALEQAAKWLKDAGGKDPKCIWQAGQIMQAAMRARERARDLAGE